MPSSDDKKSAANLARLFETTKDICFIRRGGDAYIEEHERAVIVAALRAVVAPSAARCAKCGGSGTVRCQGCDGKNFPSCAGCRGTGVRACAACGPRSTSARRFTFEQVRDAILTRMGGHTYSLRDAPAVETFMALLAQVKQSECALPAGAAAPRRCREGADRDCSPACEEKSRTYCSWKGF